MHEAQDFQGLPVQGFRFLEQLKSNNSRVWFTEHKRDYETYVKAPSQELFAALSERLGLITDEEMGGKVFRIYRDVRFSKDKTPYKSHVHMSFFPKSSSSAARVGFFFAWEPDKFFTGAGCFDMKGTVLSRYRSAVDNKETGEELQVFLDEAVCKKNMRLREPTLKRVPSPYPKDHARAELLKQKSLTIWQDTSDIKLGQSADCADIFAAQLSEMMPVYEWLSNL